jgi:hypothetical protein
MTRPRPTVGYPPRLGSGHVAGALNSRPDPSVWVDPADIDPKWWPWIDPVRQAL